MTSPNTRTRLVHRDGKKVREHRWLMEQKLGRKLTAEEHVHHKNGNPLDNRIENLEVLSPAEHMRHHKQQFPDLKICVRCATEFQVNPRKRSRNKTCSPECAQAMRVEGRKTQAESSRKSSSGSAKG